MNDPLIRYSKRLSLILRHRPELAGLTLDPAGWVQVADLLAGLRTQDPRWDLDLLQRVVEENTKQRFEFSAGGGEIRARQGHSKAVDLELQPLEPPEFLYHGTVDRFLDSIGRQGLLKRGRHHVHLSAERATAEVVGSRRGEPVVLVVRARALHATGAEFFCTANGVWLTEAVPVVFLEFESGELLGEG